MPHALVQENLPRLKEELFEFLRIPSVSARSEHREDTRRAAIWFHERLEQAGLQATLEETDGHPLVVGEWRGAGPDAPTLLVYGHYDVQPPEPLELWSSPPFDPEVRDGRIYARGVADDKGQLFLHVAALELLLATTGSLPVNVIVLAEGEEEVGSPNLLPFVERSRNRLAADGVLISDSAMFAEGLPSLLFSLRGLAYTEVRLRGARSDLHSGAYGGAVPNPATELARILATLHDGEGRVRIPGFYDDVVEWDAGTRERIRALPFSPEALRTEVGAPGLHGEAGFTALERLWIRPTCEVNGLLSGYTGEGAKTVLPAEAMAKVSFRLVPDQDPHRVVDLFRTHVARVCPPHVTVEVMELQGGRPWRARPEGRLFEAARDALETVFGVAPVLAGEGGSIPIVPDFERVLGAKVVLLGFALPGSNMHAPDEWFPEAHLEKGIRTLLELYHRL
jgi:acetylornithine deacetylase/succinyl-diaminopimelate desuccinylase-like protein